MKKHLFLLFFGIFLVPALLWAQKQSVKVANATTGLIVVDGVSVPARASRDVSLSITDNMASFEVVYYEGQERKGPEKISRPVDRGRVIIRDFGAYQGRSMTRMSEEEAAPLATADWSGIRSSTQNGEWWDYVTVSPQNKLEEYSIFVPTDPFRGLALRPGQTSSKTATLKTGEVIFPVFLAAENDDVSRTGINYSWALVNKIVTEGQETFEFLPEDIMKANSGKEVRKVITSKLPFDFMISEGSARGTVIPAGYPVRLELYLGWNIIPIQYKDSNGLPTQAILILLVNDLRRPMLARGRTGNDQVSVDRNNIVITNYGR